MKKLYIIDYVFNYGDVEQYGKATFDLEEAKQIFAEGVHAYHLDDRWDGTKYVAETEDSESLILRTIELPLDCVDCKQS